jgi:hypothetical protein
MRRVLRLAAFGLALCGGAPVLAVAQTVTLTRVPAPASAVDNYIHSVSNLDRTFAFYRDVIGLSVVTVGGDPVIHDTGGEVFVRDPGGLLLELIERR